MTHRTGPMQLHRRRRVVTVLGASLALLAVLGGAALGGYAWNNTTYAEREQAAAAAAGSTEHTHTLASGTTLNYAEGPPNGPAVLLIHAQSAAWQSYAPVLPKLSQEFHVFALDVAGHGSSARTPGRYNVHAIGADVVAFLADVVGEPAIVSGHSSGGLIAAWVAAEAPEYVAAVLFEDPPFFSTDADRMSRQFNDIDLARPAHEFLAQDTETDFTLWYIEHNAWLGYFGGGRDGIITFARNHRRDHPGEPLTIWFLPPSINKTYQYLDQFDPRFADAFFTSAWQADFDQEAALSKVDAPSILIHANWRITPAGILEGAMTDADAERACAALRHCRIERADTGHGFHDEDPGRFVELIRDLHDQID